MKLGPAIAKLGRRDPAGALEGLLAAWRKTPLPRLADAIDRISGALPHKPLDPRAQSTWMRRAKAAPPAELGGVLAAFVGGSIAETRARVIALGKRDRDPRIARALAEVLRTSPWTSDGSRTTWNVLFQLLAALDDPRMHADADAIRAGWAMRVPQRVWLEEQLTALLAKLSPARTETAADRAALDELDAALATATPAKPTAGSTTARHDTDAMLAAIYANPSDDGLRSVYADALLERGDPRGELIQLQLQATPSKQSERRIAALLKQHARTWLAGIGPVVVKDGVRFTRGFVSACKVRFKHEADVRAHGSDPAWATVEELEHSVPSWGTGSGYRYYGWIGPAMKSLRSVRVLPLNVGDLLDAPDAWDIRRLIFSSDEVADLARLAMTARLPKLEALWVTPPSPGWLATTVFAAQLRELSIRVDDKHRTWIAKATAALPKLELLVLDSEPAGLELRRDAKGRFSIGSLAVSWRQGNQLAEINMLPDGILTALTLTRGTGLPKDKIDTAFRTELTRVARKQSRLAVLDLTALGGKRTTYKPKPKGR